MRDAKQQGNQGNLVMDPDTGKMVIKSDDDMGGMHGRYWWGQNEREVTIKCRVAASTKSRGVQLTSKSQAVKLVVDGEVIAEGPLYKPVIADETLFALEDAPKGYTQFDKGEAVKYVIDPHGVTGRAVAL